MQARRWPLSLRAAAVEPRSVAVAQLKAIVFDADGVIQRRPRRWRGTLQALIGRDGDPDRLLADIFAAENPALCGECDFAEGLSEVQRRWRCRTPLAHLLDVWTMIDVDRGVTGIIRSLRAAGIQCHLATNQEAHKARYMSEELGYRLLFDREFYSCRMGVAKPAQAFFQAIVNALAEDPNRVLFIDDRPENVDAARRVGLHGAVFSLDRGVRELRRLLRDSGCMPAS